MIRLRLTLTAALCAALLPPGARAIGPQDLITQSDGSVDPVITVGRPPDGDGAHHVKVMI